MRSNILILILLTFLTDSVRSQSATAPDATRELSIEQFNTLVDRSIAVLKTKSAVAMTDKEHRSIMMCINTITFTLDDNRKRIYTEGRYRQLEDTVRARNYMKEAMKTYPDCIPKGLGVYFPKLRMELYGTPSQQYVFRII